MIVVAIFALLLGLPGGSGVAHAGWEEALTAARQGGADGSVRYEAPGRARHAAETVYFAALVAAARLGVPTVVAALGRLAPALGLCVRTGRDLDGPYALVTELPTARRGAGAYVIRIGRVRTETIVQAPHTFSDEGTLPLAVALFRAADARALAVNTVHRRGQAGQVPVQLEQPSDESSTAPPQGGADVAHDEEATFQAMTTATLLMGGARSVVQLHGYADGRVAADVVLSAGRKGSGAPRWLRAARSQVAQALPGAQVVVYPDDVDRLGARTNVQGKITRRARARFVHVELGASLRNRLRDDEDACHALIAALARIAASEN